MSKWETAEEEARRLFPGDFLTGDEDDWEYERCAHDGYKICRCREREEEDRLHELELDMMHLYYEAQEEDHERTEEVKRAAEQAKWDSETAEDESRRVHQDELGRSFSPFWYDLIGLHRYNKLITPILIKIYRIKKRRRR